ATGNLEKLQLRISELENLLEESRAKLAEVEQKAALNRHLVEHSLGLMCVHDLNGTLLAINPAAAASLGFTPDEGRGRNIREFLAPSVRHLFDAYLERIRRQGSDTGLMRLVARDGTERIWSYRNIRFEEPGCPACVLGHAQDVTSFVHVERALRESEQRFRIVSDTAPVMIWMWDVRMHGTFFNRSWLTFVGGTLAEQLGARWMDGVHPEDLLGVVERCGSAIRDRISFAVEYRLRRHDGEYRWVQSFGVPQFHPENELAGYVGSSIDITEARRARAELERKVAERTVDLEMTNQRLLAEMKRREQVEEELLRARKLESLAVLAGGIAHDFNNLLTVLAGNLDVAKMHVVPHDPLNVVLGRMEEACAKAADLSQQLLTFAKGGNPIRQTASIASLLEKTAVLALAGSQSKLHLRIAPDLWCAAIDVGQIRQVIHNVLMNACEAMSAGGTITVSAENTQIDSGALPLAPGRYVKIFIEDRGIGIPRERLSRIFDPYFSTKPAGSGLGLATAYAIVKKHDGLITAESQPGEGTVVSIYLPASAAKEKRIAATRQAAAGGRKFRVLLMDDDEAIRVLASHVLTKLGYDAVCAASGEEAVRLYEASRRLDTPFDAVILDLNVPGVMGGKETILRLLEIDPQVKAVVSSGYSDDPVMSEFESYGFRAVLAKPWSVSLLREVLETVIASE